MKCDNCFHKEICTHRIDIQNGTYGYMRYNFDTNQCSNYVNYNDITPAVCGEWKESNIPCEDYVCSVCGGSNWYYGQSEVIICSKYCPNCGARMIRGKQQ